ncbi:MULTISPECIES: hypothetical protein [Streptomyces]|jgi:hypothetical protein|uniref:Uncharacterized protein n=1 Tax=Streptomyces thermoviolaceus subsp. thermoviolaceus TaxID=66860 RepID=A0ABX0YVJ3_STRTL|nr:MULTISPECIES: hypothetical protein [Streptomyces]MCM3266663.1 hypothetical protein [Streptomyces thermoviolaceus]NJP16042.1 hypothetical protein [Streptomyces thermoviolaceus subsp. thermoviolaceus]RSR99937.1 hypothetical protein EF917_17995 [Streptomyces sp. WAC00469]WTD48231.1 hypothetical protein OG899_12290 [Streptomyces thermoviolaceus]GGV70622.1 hypothetical protein GCM10010499_20330 [Streptomyces thermoviolaceus subsp. apingens]
MSAVSLEELGNLSGEVLPERSVLSTVVPFNNWGGAGHDGGASSSSSALALGGGDHHSVVTSSACQSTFNQGTPGLIGALGLGSNNPVNSVTCTPATTAVS